MKAFIRRANSDDAEGAWEIRKAAVLHQCQGYYRHDVLVKWVGNGDSEKFAALVKTDFYVAFVGGVMVGTGMINLSSGHLDAIFVTPDWMGHGIGSAMMNHLENLGEQSGLTTLTLESTLNAVSFYRRFGFVGEQLSMYHSPNGISMACVPMRKTLSCH